VQALGTIVIGTVQGDLHDIGKNIVATMMEGADFEVIDLGTDVAPESFVDAVRRHQPALVGLPALLTTTMPRMKATIEAFDTAGVRDKVQVMIGGAPLTEAFAREIGADIYAPDTSDDEVPTVAGRRVASSSDLAALPDPQLADGRTGVHLEAARVLVARAAFRSWAGSSARSRWRDACSG